jgi:hypothetical protein
MNRPVPSHHGHRTLRGVPPRFEITVPVPRHGGHGRGSVAASPPCGVSSAIDRVRLPVPSAAPEQALVGEARGDG